MGQDKNSILFFELCKFLFLHHYFFFFVSFCKKLKNQEKNLYLYNVII
jgi:hypothetical protein